MAVAPTEQTFESVKERLAQIAEEVSDENLPLDDALDLYEEAVSLGLKVTDLLEVGIPDDEEEADESDKATAQDGKPDTLSNAASHEDASASQDGPNQGEAATTG